jgi:hypothetical protein
MSDIGLSAATAFSYALGPRMGWMAESKSVIAISTVAIIAGMTAIAIVGLRVGKWVHNAGSDRGVECLRH